MRIFTILLSFFMLLIMGEALAEEYCSIPCSSWYVNAEFLYWRAFEDNLHYSSNMTSTPPPGAGVLAYDGKVQELNWRWRPGFRVGLGRVGCEGWDLSVLYTWYQTKADGSATHNFLLGVWDPGAFSWQNASGKWNLHYQTLELVLTKPLYVGRYFTFNPFVALMGAHTHEKYDLHYFNTVNPLSVRVHNAQKLWAIGPKVGFRATRSFCRGWFLTGEGSIASLLSHYNVRRNDQTNLIFENEVPNRITDSFHALRLIAQHYLGVGWGHYLCSNRYHADIMLAWEHQILLDHNQMFFGPITAGFREAKNQSPLSLYGLTLKTNLNF
jgi:hypothetical protein